MPEPDVLLRGLGERAEFPGEDTLAARVLDRLAAEQSAAPLAPRHGPGWRRALVAAAAAILVLVATLVVSPPARDAVADFLGIGDIRVLPAADFGMEVRPPVVVPAGAAVEAALGPQVPSVAAAVDATGFRLQVPAALGAPDSVHVQRSAAGVAATLRWAPGDALPATADPSTGALLTVLRAAIETGLVDKHLTPRTAYERLTIGGEPAALITGGPHVVLLRAADGSVIEQTTRLAGTTLLWTVGDLTYRLEAELPREALVAIAESIG
jgi:hypothetical protein